MAVPRPFVLALLLAAAWIASAAAQAPVAYQLSFPERAHRLMQVELTVPDVPAGPLRLRMSRSSPGRYALHEFAKNVFDVRVTDAAGRALAVTRPDPHTWEVTAPAGDVQVRYRIFGDRVDGTYLGVDSTHAHINMPAALLWAVGLESRPATVRFVQPEGAAWRVATQLFPGPDPLTFTAPSLQYLMDSPSEFSAFVLRSFTVDAGGRRPLFRVAVHHTGTDAEVDAYARDVEKIVREARHVFGEYPRFENDTYTFIADYLPWASGDGMEHRNSTILTSSLALRTNRLALLDTVSHEFVHAWNVERIRPQALEPFDFTDANMSGELWFAEGFTSYYGPLVMARAGLYSPGDLAQEFGAAIDTVRNSPGRQLHSAVEMSQLAPFVDAATSIDRTTFGNTYISYYIWGEVIGLGLDLALRDRTDGGVTLDDYMRALWQRFGTRDGAAPGVVPAPYDRADLQATLAEVSGDAAFAADFFARFIEGREVVDFGRLLPRAGFALDQVAPGRAFAGSVTLQDGQRGVRVTGSTPFGTPLYAAGVDRDDVIVSIANVAVTRADDVERLIGARQPGDTVPIVFERRGQQVRAMLTLTEDPRVAVVPVEAKGQTLTADQRRFREAWLGSRENR